MSVQVNVERLYTLANDAFAGVDKAVVELQLVGVFIDELYHDFLHMNVMRKSKNISGCSTICIDIIKFVKEISVKVR